MKGLPYVNLVGVLALAALCVVQWQGDRRLNLEVNRLEQIRLDQGAKLAEQATAMRGLNSDLAEFKQQFAKTQTELNDARQTIRAAKRDSGQLKTSVADWAAAVATRDERLKEANEHLGRLADELNASIRKFNELVTNHNTVVKDLNDLRARTAPTPATR